MGLFKNLKDATYTKRGTYMEPNARYVLELLQLETGTTFGGDEHFIASFKIIETSAESQRPGDEVNYYCGNYGKGKANFLGNVKKVFVALYGTMNGSPVNPSDIGEAEAEALMLAHPTIPGALPGTAAKGVRVEARTKGTKTKAGNDFTVIEFFPVI
jgi:hypothetical protein